MSLSTGIDLPETFKGRVLKDIRFQGQAVRYLQNAITSERLASTYLFTGPEGAGKEKTAIAFAKALNCEHKKSAPCQTRDCEEPDSCDECSTCKRMDSLNHPDLIVLKPQGKAYLIRLDDVRLLQKRMALKPYEARMKIGLVLNADNMNEESQNALLKLLEEPPAKSILILTSQEPKHLLSTIVSRCQKVRFSSLKREDIERLLIKDYEIKSDYSKVLSRLSGGGVSEALGFDKDDREDKIQWFFKGDLPIYELLGGMPDYSDRPRINRKSDYELYHLRSIEFRQNSYQKMRTILEASRQKPFYDQHRYDDLFDVYITKFNGNSDGFIEWYKKNYPQVYLELF